MKQFFKIAFIITGIVAIGLFFVLIFEIEEKTIQPASEPITATKITPTIKPTITPIGPKQNSFYENYMRGCIRAGEDTLKFRNYCKCTYDYMVDNYGEDGFYSISLDYVKTEKMPQELLDAVEECLFHLETNTN